MSLTQPSEQNPAAFARPTGAGSNDQQGMTLRDYFAAKAMQGLIARPNFAQNMEDATDVIPEMAFLYADAMLAARLHLPTEESKK